MPSSSRTARLLALALIAGAGLTASTGPLAQEYGAQEGRPEVAGGDTILPGWWRYTTRALLVYNKTEKRCIKPNEIEKVMAGAINRHLHCTYPTRNQSFGHVAMSGICVDKKGRRIPVSMTGSFSPTTLDLDITVSGFIPVSLRGKRLAATCPGVGEEG